MSIEQKQRYSVKEYLALERESEIKHEYWNGEIFAMTGASFKHNRIAVNVSRILDNQLENRECDVLAGDMRVKITATGLYTYPDVVVVCGEPELEIIEGMETLLNPVLIVEVLSPSTKDYDQGSKFDHYRSLESLGEYVLINQNEPHVMLYVKQPDGSWNLSETREIDSTIHLPLLDCNLALREVYRRVKFK
jgi:Uma2 family endonuclease